MWKIIEDYPNYEVNELGQVRSCKGKILKPRFEKCGYIRYRLYNNGVSKDILAHRLVATSFIPNAYPLKTDVNHINGNKKDNRVTNLEWVTKSENIKHAQDIGLKTYETISHKVIAQGKNKTLVFKSLNECGRYFNCKHDVIKYNIIHKREKFGYLFIYA